MHEFVIGRTSIMAILNVTPDSFYDGSAYFSPELAIARALELEAQGADIIDIGAQSTRPGAVPVPPEEELCRLLPVLEVLRGRVNVPISIDTYFPEVAEQALQRGAVIVNDVSGRVTQEMARVVRRHNAGWVLMHNPGGADMIANYAPDVVTAVRERLTGMAAQAMLHGIAKAQLCIDPGIGFGKSYEDNLRLIANTRKLKMDGIALLVGASRKRVTGEDAPPSERLGGTIAAHVIAQMGGADILRVHDAAEARQAMNLTEIVIST